MSKHKEPFRFKMFEVEHCKSSMKVGVDAVALGAWCGGTESGSGNSALSILDVGCGCGVISLMLAQRWNNSKITAIDIDKPSVKECGYNFQNSPWGERLEAINIDFFEFCSKCKESGILFDCIVSNPPYFESGLANIDSARLKARHQSELNPVSVILGGSEILKSDGWIALVVPFDQESWIRECCIDNSLRVTRLLRLRDRAGKVPKRSFIQISKEDRDSQTEIDEITIKGEDGEYSEVYKNLCKDFYIKF